MILEEFLARLEKVVPQFSWRKTIIGELRGTHKNGLGFCGCPITCVLYAQEHYILPNCLYRKGAELIGMQIKDANTIAACADYPTNVFQDDYHEEIRSKLLQICGLKED